MLKAIKDFESKLNTRTVAQVGAVLFVPSLTLLVDPSIATSAISAVFPHVPAIAVKFLAASVASYAARLLYLARPYTVPDSKG